MSINKLSKYGIVLVAAVTVATVAQSQFGQSSSKVYADEIASTVPTTSEAPSTTPATSENVSTTPAMSTSPETSEAPVVSTTPATSEAPAVVSTSENSEASATSENSETATMPIWSETETDSPINEKAFKYISTRFVESTDRENDFGGGSFSLAKDQIFTVPDEKIAGYYYTITSADGKKYLPGDIIKYADLKFDDPSNYRVGEINVLTYTYYKDKSSMIEAPSLSKPSGYSYKYNSLKPSTIDQGIRSAWDHGDTMTYHVHYRVFDRNSKYGVPVFEDIAPYDTVIVPKNGSIKVNARVIPGYTLDSQHMFNDNFNSSDKTMTIQPEIGEDGYFLGVVDKNGIPMVGFTYFKDNSESAFKDSMTPAVSSLNTSGKTLTYTVRKYYNGRLGSHYQNNIEPGESKRLYSFSIGALGAPDTTLYETPGYFEVTYDDVKAGKNLYEFWLYQPDFFNADGTPKDTATPETSVAPAISEAPAVSTTPTTSEAPAVSTTPVISEAPAVSTAPATSETPAVSTTPATSETPTVSTTPATSETPAVSTTPVISEAPAVSVTPATSEAPAVSTAPATSEAPAVSTTPATSESPAVSMTPATSEAPAVSTTPATSEAPAVSTTPVISEAPAVTPSTSANPASSVTLDKLSQKAYKEMSSAQKGALVSSSLASKAEHSMDSAMISSTQSHDEGMTPATDGNLVGHNLPNTGDTNAKVGILGMIFVGLGLTSLAYKGRHRRSK